MPSVQTRTPQSDQDKGSRQSLQRAAGGVVWRSTKDGRIEVLLVHRPHREDWTFPKGKLEPGETFEECALREVLEETGLTCRLEEYVGTAEYTHRKGRPKVVAYWLMSVKRGAFSPNDEVDEVVWLSPAKARPLLTYERDREILDLLDGTFAAVA